MKLAQTGSEKLNAAAFALMDNNVSTQMLKNLVTDMPAPITTKLAQTGSSSEWSLFDNNVSSKMMKNLVTDMPAPITTKLAQTDSKKLNAAAFALMDNNVSTQM